MPETKVYDDYQAMSDDCELRDLITYEVRGVRKGAGISGFSDEEPDDREREDDDWDLDGHVFARLMDSQTVFEVRHRLHVDGTAARFTVDVGAIFEFPQKSSFESSAQSEFIGKVGLMVLDPHVRESLFSLSTKIGVDPVILPLRKNYEVDKLDPSTSEIDLFGDHD